LTIAQPASRYTTMPARRIEAPGSAKAAVVDLLKRGFQTQSVPNALAETERGGNFNDRTTRNFPGLSAIGFRSIRHK
jgi:hypothetical protein